MDTAGILPASDRAPLATATAAVAQPAVSPYGKEALDALWAIVEADIPGESVCVDVSAY